MYPVLGTDVTIVTIQKRVSGKKN